MFSSAVDRCRGAAFVVFAGIALLVAPFHPDDGRRERLGDSARPAGAVRVQERAQMGSEHRGRPRRCPDEVLARVMAMRLAGIDWPTSARRWTTSACPPGDGTPSGRHAHAPLNDER